MPQAITFVDSSNVIDGSSGNLPLIRVENSLGCALIALQGAQVLSFQPKNAQEMLWISPKANFAPGIPLRGGIPLSIPWFAFHNDDLPVHGFVRTESWTLASQGTADDESTWLELELKDSAQTRAWWGGPFRIVHTIRVGRELRLELAIHNDSPAPVRLESVWHSYFAIGAIDKVGIMGLDGCPGIDKNRDRSRFVHYGKLRVQGPTDLIFPRVPAIQVLERSQGAIQVASSCQGAVVCNHWNMDSLIDDLGEGSHCHFVCLERGDLDETAIDLAGNSVHRAWMRLSPA